MKKFLSAIVFIFALSTGKAQDFHLSMYDAAPVYLNPAMTGLFEGVWRAHGHFRTQWKAVNFKPFVTGLASFDAPYKKWGFGGQIVNYRAGIGNYNALQAVVSSAYSLSIDQSKNHNISFGLQAGVTQKSIEHQLHTFNNQYTTANGGGFDNSLSNGEGFGGQSIFLPEFNAGVLYYHSRSKARLNPFLGVSAFNIIQPKESWLGDDNDLPFRLYVHGGVRLNLLETFYVIPKILLMQQREFTEVTLAGDFGVFFKSNEFYLLGGLTYRNLDAFVFSIGARKDSYIAKLSYDINSSSLAPASTGRGAFELSFTYMHQKKDSQNVKICPRL